MLDLAARMILAAGSTARTSSYVSSFKSKLRTSVGCRERVQELVECALAHTCSGKQIHAICDALLHQEIHLLV
jgi:hypothetical protein